MSDYLVVRLTHPQASALLALANHAPAPAGADLEGAVSALADACLAAPVLEPDPDLVMLCDTNNVAHVLRAPDERSPFAVTLCGSPCPRWQLDLLETLSATWTLLNDRQYRAWPPWPCQSCLAMLAS